MSGILSMIAGGTYSSRPVNTVAPVVSGTATFGQTLSTTNGTWTGAPAPTFTYQWQRAGSNIGSATASTYVLVAADVGNTIRCVVTATNVVGSASANSNSTSAVAATVPGAPTIGSATNAGADSVTVTYTAPASNGGATITSYTATSSPGNITGTLSTAGSGTITVTGLTTGQAYTFTVKATNSAGQSAASGASNSATPTLVPSSQIYTSGTYTWVAPAGVTSVSLLAVGRGGNGGTGQSIPVCCCQTVYVGGDGGGGGGLAYRNNLSVTPGTSYAVSVQDGQAQKVYFQSATYFYANNANNSSAGSGGGSVGAVNSFGGGTGGGSLCSYQAVTGGGGGGAAGYAGSGGNGANYNGNGQNGVGGAGGGGSGGGNSGIRFNGGGGGGGVGLYGSGASGTGAPRNSVNNIGATGGGGGSGGGAGGSSCGSGAGGGGSYGGGAGGGSNGGGGAYGPGALRIVWPGSSRSFPSTSVSTT